MEQLIIQLISGAIGGNAVAAAVKKLNLGVLGNSIAGIVGGGLGGQLLAMIGGGGAIDAAAGGDMTTILTSIASGAVGGGVVMALAGAVRNAMTR